MRIFCGQKLICVFYVTQKKKNSSKNLSSIFQLHTKMVSPIFSEDKFTQFKIHRMNNSIVLWYSEYWLYEKTFIKEKNPSYFLS